MATRWGMSKEIAQPRSFSESSAQSVDQAVRKLLLEAQDRALEIIRLHHAEQNRLAVATAMAQDRVNISPKDVDSLRVISKQRVVWLNLTGSGNETSAHVQTDSRMTLMFCAFGGSSLIVRIYGNAKVIHKNDPQWHELIQLFEPVPGAWQIFDLAVELVQISCGMAVLYFEYQGERDELRH